MFGYETMKIRSIKRTKYNNCYTIFENGEELSFSMDITVKYKLKVGLEIDDSLFQDMCDEQNVINAKRKAHNFISYRPRSELEVRRKLKDLEYNQEVIENTIDFLYAFDYLNDEKFAMLFAKDHLKRKPAGKQKIRQELNQKGIDEDVTNKTIAILFEENDPEYFIRQAADKKLRQVSYKPIEKQKTAVINYLLRQGFGYAEIKHVLIELFE